MRWNRNRELREEIEAHLAMAQQERVERGEAPDSADRAVRREFGNRSLIEETTREMWGWRWIERLGQDLRYGARCMRRARIHGSGRGVAGARDRGEHGDLQLIDR
jgi:hypothetical protein